MGSRDKKASSISGEISNPSGLKLCSGGIWRVSSSSNGAFPSGIASAVSGRTAFWIVVRLCRSLRGMGSWTIDRIDRSMSSFDSAWVIIAKELPITDENASAKVYQTGG